MAGTTPIGLVRKLNEKTIKRAMKRTELERSEVEAGLAEVDITQGPDNLTALFREKQVEALIIATSAVPKIRILSILKVLILKLFGRSGRPSFWFRKGGTPQEVDWIGQKNQIDAAVQAGCVRHIVLCSSMGGTQPDNFLNTIGQRSDGSGGQILLWKRKAEQYLINSGLKYTIIHPGGLTDKPGGRRLVFGVDDELLKQTVRNIPREDVAEVLVQSLFIRAMRKRSLDVISQEEERLPGAAWTSMTTSTSLGNCRYDIELPEPVPLPGTSA